MREQVARLLVSRGIQQWLPGEFKEEVLRGWMRHDHLFVVRDGTALVAAVAVLDEDPIWPEKTAAAGYIHFLMVAPERFGSGLGKRVLAAAEDLLATREKTLARLDVVRTNTRLLEWYDAQGYRRVGAREFPEPASFDVVLLEKELPWT